MSIPKCVKPGLNPEFDGPIAYLQTYQDGQLVSIPLGNSDPELLMHLKEHARRIEAYLAVKAEGYAAGVLHRVQEADGNK